jgi:hypothetical protein
MLIIIAHINAHRRTQPGQMYPFTVSKLSLSFLAHRPDAIQHAMDLNEESLNFLSLLLSCEKVTDGNGPDILDCKEFWRSENVFEWFKGKGYSTYIRSSQGAFCDSPRLPYDDYCECDYPFAYHQADNDLAARDITVRAISFARL